MQMNPYLSFDGTCREAFARYAEILGGEVVALFDGSMAPEGAVEEDWGDRVMHAEVVVGDQHLMGADTPPGTALAAGAPNLCVSVMVDGPAEAERVFAALCDGGSVQMPLGETFFADRFGMCTDRFGTPWLIVGPDPNETT